MKHVDRFIVAVYYAIGGVVLGFGVALYFSLYASLEIGSAQIVLSSVILCFAMGYLFPHAVGTLFKWIWRLFTH